MSDRKNPASKSTKSAASRTKAPKASSRRRSASGSPDILDAVQRAGSRFDVSDYIRPASAVLATGALAAAGYVFRSELGELLVDAVRTATAGGKSAAAATSRATDIARTKARDVAAAVSEGVSVDSILHYAGLERRSTMRAVMGPAVGVVCGMIVGSVVTHFFGDLVLSQLRGIAGDGADSTDSVSPAAESEADASMPVDPTRPNGGVAHRGVS